MTVILIIKQRALCEWNRSASVKRQMRDLSQKIGFTLQPVFVSRKIATRTQAQRNQDSNRKSTMCLFFYMGSV